MTYSKNNEEPDSIIDNDLNDPYADMPPLLCSDCDLPQSYGGWIYRHNNPISHLCMCSRKHSRPTTQPDVPLK